MKVGTCIITQIAVNNINEFEAKYKCHTITIKATKVVRNENTEYSITIHKGKKLVVESQTKRCNMHDAIYVALVDGGFIVPYYRK